MATSFIENVNLLTTKIGIIESANSVCGTCMQMMDEYLATIIGEE